jgi:uncharacterized membrane protein YphA (DoxX/SURF4 family)
MHWIVLLGQAIIGIVFIAVAINDFQNRELFMSMLAAKHVPYYQYVFPGVLCLRVVCGLALIADIFAPLAAFLLAVVTLASTILFYEFWRLIGPERKIAYLAFLANMAIIGGLIVVIGV